MQAWVQWQALDQENSLVQPANRRARHHDTQAKRYMQLCSIRRLTASATVASAVDARQFRNGRQLPAPDRPGT